VLFGEHNAHLHYIEDMLSVDIASRGNEIQITGEPEGIKNARNVLDMLWKKLEREQNVTVNEVDAAIRFTLSENEQAQNGSGQKKKFYDEKTAVKIGGKNMITPRTPNQADYIDAIRKHDMVFGVGPGGTGKTFLAVATGVAMYNEGLVERLIFCRPAVEAGERLGFLPGDMLEKIDPYLRPIYDALRETMPAEKMAKKIENGEIEIAPLAFMRGRTLKNAFVVLDEAQNTTEVQMKMFLTRMGEGTHMIITGDPSQTDLPKGTGSGLMEAMNILSDVPEVAFINFTSKDVVRHKLVSKIIDAYDSHGK